MKILFIDVETSKMLALIYRLYEDRTGPDDIIENTKIIVAAWKWLGEDKVHHVSWKPCRISPDCLFTGRTDRIAVKAMWKAIEEADVIVAHNCDRFDFPTIKTRAEFFKLNPIVYKRTVDTLKVAKSTFRFASNSLDYIATYLKLGQKIKNPPGLWKRVMLGSNKDRDAALKEMVQYCIHDVRLLEKVYLALRPWMKNHPNWNLYNRTPDPHEHGCPTCGGTKFKRNGTRDTMTGLYQLWRCLNKKCNRQITGTKIIRGSRTEVK